MKNYRIAVLGSTGVVGREMIRLIEAGGIPAELVPLGSARSAGSTIEFHGEPVTVREATGNSFFGADFVLGAAKNAVARLFAPAIAESGAVFIDNSSAFRLMDDVPLVVPEINGADAFSHHGIIANPNCSTIIALMAAAPLNRLSRIETMTACTYQAVSGAGKNGIDELHDEVAALAAGKPVEPKVFQYQIAYNVIPQIGGEAFEGYTSEEMKMQNEGRKILHLPDLKVSCTCVRVPVVRSHSVSIVVRTKDKISVADAKAAIANYTKYMAAELAMKFSPEMRVNAIVPGFLLTNQNRALLTNEDGSYTDRARTIIAHTPAGRFAEPEELLGTIHYLVSDASSFVTGALAGVDGGFDAFSI